jgi:phosphatidylglycerophosphate synthase
LPSTSALILATARGDDGRAAAAAPFEESTLVCRLAEQLASLGIADVRVLTRPELAAELERAATTLPIEVSSSLTEDLRVVESLAREAGGDVVLVQGDILTQREALAGLVADPRIATGVLAGPGDGAEASRLRVRRGRVIAAASPFHFVRRPTGSFRGVLRVAAQDSEALGEAAGRLAELTDPEPPPSWARERDRKGAATDGEDVTALLLVGLVRGGTPVASAELRAFYWARPRSGAELAAAAAELPAHDEERLRLDSAVKASDGFFTTYFVSPYSKHVARWAAHHGLTPNQVTTASVIVGLLAAVAFASGERWGLVAGAVLLQIAFATDCVDGQLARYTRRFSPLGGWLDSVFDRTKEYAVYAGLAIGAERTGDPAWILAAAALTLQTVRHMIDFSYAAAHEAALGTVAQPPLEWPGDTEGHATPSAVGRDESELEAEVPDEPTATLPLRRRIPQVALRGWHGLDGLPAVTWLKKIFALPIGERFALISLTAALFDARVTFVALLAWGGVAMGYQLAGRVLRTAAR